MSGSNMVSGMHEAAHAWAYWIHAKPLRYITIRPKAAGLTGMCQIWKPRRMDIGVAAWIAAAGPIGEALHSQENDPDSEFEWDDHLFGAILAGGHDDLARSSGMLDNREIVEHIRGRMQRDWSRITALGEWIAADKTVSGAQAFNILGES